MPESIFKQIGTAGVGFLLIIAGVIFTQIEGMLELAKFCISLGICVLFIILASKFERPASIILGVIAGGAFVAAIIFVVNAV